MLDKITELFFKRTIMNQLTLFPAASYIEQLPTQHPSNTQNAYPHEQQANRLRAILTNNNYNNAQKVVALQTFIANDLAILHNLTPPEDRSANLDVARARLQTLLHPTPPGQNISINLFPDANEQPIGHFNGLNI